MTLRCGRNSFDFHFLHTLLCFLQLSIDRLSLTLTRQTQARILAGGLEQDAFLATKIISAYSACGSLADSLRVFRSISLKNVFLWNSLISGYVKNGASDEACDLFYEMQRSSVSPDDYSLATMAKVCGEGVGLEVGELIHGKSVKLGFDVDVVVANSLMSMYCKCGEFMVARKLFDEIPDRNSGSWNVLLAGYASFSDCRYHKKIWEIVKDMQIDGIKPDAFTLSTVLPFCGGNTERWDYGKELHCYILKSESDFYYRSNVHLGSCLIDMYSKNNNVTMSRRVFEQMRSKNVYIWVAMIGGYIRNGESDEAMILFCDMQGKDRIEPSRISLVTILQACSSQGRLMNGKQIHVFALRKELNNDVSLCNSLIDMYCKCGSSVYARRVFDESSFSRDAISWTAMISGYGLHGQGEEAILLFNRMIHLGLKPDTITIVGVLSACGRSGLVDEGLDIYNKVLNELGIEPTIEICAAVVDMVARSGQLNLVLDFIKTMPVKPGPSVWGALLTSSLNHGNSEMQDLAYKFLVELEPLNPSNFVLLSNLHASSSKWEVVSQVRKAMKERGLKKVAGCSWIVINNNTHCFHVADKTHPSSESIYRVVDSLVCTMKGSEYAIDYEILGLTEQTLKLHHK